MALTAEATAARTMIHRTRETMPMTSPAVQKRGNELMLRFPHGECFALALRQICRKETENA